MQIPVHTHIHTIPRNREEELRFSLNEYEERCYADIRVWFCSEGAEGMRPSKKGISIPLHRMEEFLEGIEKTAACVEKKLAAGTVRKDSRASKERSKEKEPAQRRYVKRTVTS